MSPPPFDDRTTGSLIDQALDIADWQDDDTYWQIVKTLQNRDDDATFAEVVAICHGGTIEERRLGADVLSQFAARTDGPLRDSALPVLIDMARNNVDAEAVASIIGALAQIRHPFGLPAVLAHIGHPNALVRQHVAMALPDLAGVPVAQDAVDGLVRLSRDPDRSVRDWATFGLGTQLDSDSGDVRGALAARVDDEDAVTSGEALVGLARRHDPRAFTHILDRLRSLALADYLIDAAAELGDPRFLPLLQDLQDTVGVFNGRAASLEEAIESCGGGTAGVISPSARVDQDHPVALQTA